MTLHYIWINTINTFTIFTRNCTIKTVFLQEHFIDEQVPVQLHSTTFNIHCGAGGDSVVMGYSLSSRETQPQSVGSKCFPFHCWTCRKTLWLWYLAAPDVGGKSCGSTQHTQLVRYFTALQGTQNCLAIFTNIFKNC